jgi:hypothetical protein
MINSLDLIESVASHAMASGHFAKVNQYEPKSAPDSDLTASVWAARIGPAPSHSGLAATTAYVVLNVRLYTNMLADPQDMIDPKLMQATDELMAAYSSDFTLDGLVRNIDLLGMGGETLSAEAGYVQIGGVDGGMFRVMTITLPMIIDEAWEHRP